MPPRETGRGSYVRVVELARGGMGSVELVLRREGDFSRLLAVKRLLPAYREDPAFREMFLDEARVSGLLRHRNVVSVIDVGEDDDGPFLVMDFVDGVSVARLIRRAAAGGLLPVQFCVRVAIEIAEGLHAAHELRAHDGTRLNLVHRDVTPQNVLLSWDGGVLLTDFGIAKALGRSTKTSTGILKGKLGYMSPEQLRFREPDARSDLFSLGIVLFELLSLTRLYADGEGLEPARRILEEPPPDIAEHRTDVPPALVELLFALLAKEPDERPATAGEVARGLTGVLSEVLAEEDPVAIREVLADRLPGLREATAKKREEALERAERVRREGVELNEAETTPAVSGVRRPRRRAALAGAVVAGAVVAATGAALVWRAAAGGGPAVQGPGPRRATVDRGETRAGPRALPRTAGADAGGEDGGRWTHSAGGGPADAAVGASVEDVAPRVEGSAEPPQDGGWPRARAARRRGSLPTESGASDPPRVRRWAWE